MFIVHPDMIEDLEKLYLSGLQFLAPLTPEETYAKVVEEAKKLTGASYGTILLMQNNTLTRVYTTIPIALESTSRPKGFSFNAFATGEPSIVDAKEVLPHHPELKKIHLKASIMIPLSYYHYCLGVLVLAMSKKAKITKRHLQTLKLFGAITSLSIKKTQLYNEAKQALETQDLFLNMAAHELRTPLTAMNVYTHLLKKKFENEDGPEAQWVQELSRESVLLTRFINELLNVELLREGKFIFTKHVIDFRDIINRVLKQFYISHPYHKIVYKDLIKNGQPIIEGDFDRVTQMLHNILENAAKFSSMEKEIIFSLTLNKGDVVITIADKGIGIAEKDIHEVTNIFFKGKTNYKEGIGLGLYLSKIIVNEHHGNIAISSVRNKGTCVKINIPVLKI